ncbi:hypothetical protein HrrHc1_085 [Halorubrum phage Hardycor1]|nr:hypothetical protein HrrHc1_085 [Halorubrum phage Hardycor1]
MSANRNLADAVRRHTGRELGEQVTVRNYAFGDEGRAGDEAYGDDTTGRVERPDSPHESVPATMGTSGGEDGTERNTGATRPAMTVVLLLPDDHAATANLAGGPNDSPRSRIERTDGAVLAVETFRSQGNGLVEVTAEVVEV